MIDLTPDENVLWLVPELTLLLWLPEKTIWELVRSGELPSVNVNGYRCIRDTDAVAFMRKQAEGQL